MWIIDVVLDGFDAEVPVAPIAVFRICFATACLVKFAVETRRGHHRYMDEGAYLAVMRTARRSRPPLDPLTYRTGYAVKFLAAVLLLVGVFPQVAAGVLALWFVLECTVLFKFHTSYFALLALALAISPAAGDALSLDALTSGERSSDATGDALGAAMIVATTTVLYLGSAFRKFRSEPFRSGTALRAAVRYNAETNGRHHLEAWYPNALAVRAGAGGADRRATGLGWTLIGSATIAVEVALPLLLLVGGWWTLAGAVIGVAMHGAFTFLLPVTLSHFSLATVSTYILFIPPERATEAIDALAR